MLQHDKIMLRKRSLIETVNDQLKNICQVELDPPSLLPKLHYQSVIGFGRFLLLRQKTFHQHRRGVCTSLFPAGCLGRTRVKVECLHGSVFHCRYSQRTQSAIALFDVDSSQWLRLIASAFEFAYRLCFCFGFLSCFHVHPGGVATSVGSNSLYG